MADGAQRSGGRNETGRADARSGEALAASGRGQWQGLRGLWTTCVWDGFGLGLGRRERKASRGAEEVGERGEMSVEIGAGLAGGWRSANGRDGGGRQTILRSDGGGIGHSSWPR